MNPAPEMVRRASGPGAAVRPLPVPGGTAAPAPTRPRAARRGSPWLARAAWAIQRTGRPGMVGIALLLAAAVFLPSTYLEVAGEVAALRAGLAAARTQPRPAEAPAAEPAAPGKALPPRSDMPAILRQLFAEAARARLAIDTGKYEVKAAGGAGVVRHQIAFPVAGPYPQIRAFIDATLAALPAVALSDLALARRSIADGDVEAQLRWTAFTSSAGPAAAAGGSAAGAAPGREGTPQGAEARPAAGRVVAPAHAAALFAQRSWTVLKPVKVPPPPPPALPAPPPAPTAPPLPYALMGSYAPAGGTPVFFLARGDQVIDARLGDRLDGVYQLEAAADGQLTFLYLPLNTRQNLSAGAPK